jgi:hypothetical protein
MKQNWVKMRCPQTFICCSVILQYIFDILSAKYRFIHLVYWFKFSPLISRPHWLTNCVVLSSSDGCVSTLHWRGNICDCSIAVNFGPCTLERSQWGMKNSRRIKAFRIFPQSYSRFTEIWAYGQLCTEKSNGNISIWILPIDGPGSI